MFYAYVCMAIKNLYGISVLNPRNYSFCYLTHWLTIVSYYDMLLDSVGWWRNWLYFEK